MPLEDLEEQGVILPEAEWGTHATDTTVDRPLVGGAMIVAAAALVATYLGEGGLLTWIGVTVFLVAFFAVVIACDRAIVRQRRRVRRERRGEEEGGAEEGR